jgi:putative transcriptional regulator
MIPEDRPLASRPIAAARASGQHRTVTTKIAPGFLVAAPSLLDPNFARTVVLLVDHREEGSLGFVVNRPADMRIRAMVEPLGLGVDAEKVVDGPVLVGGPVAPNTGWVVFERTGAQDPQSDVVQVSERLCVSASRDLLESMVVGTDRRMLLVLGYAGWGPGQLDEELSQGAWIPVDLDERIVFDTPYDDRWGNALRLLGIDPARLTGVAPSSN